MLRRLLPLLLFLPIPTLASSTLWPDLSRAKPDGTRGSSDAAIIVSVSDYKMLRDVPGATQNSSDWYSYFTQSRGIPPVRVRLLEDSAASREAILTAVRETIPMVQPGGNMWFVFIGHTTDS